MEKDIKIEIKDEEASAREFVDAWHRAEKGKVPEEPVNRVYFQNLEALLKILTPKRLELLKAIHNKGDMSIRYIAAHLKRDYKKCLPGCEVFGDCRTYYNSKKWIIRAMGTDCCGYPACSLRSFVNCETLCVKRERSRKRRSPFLSFKMTKHKKIIVFSVLQG